MYIPEFNNDCMSRNQQPPRIHYSSYNNNIIITMIRKFKLNVYRNILLGNGIQLSCSFTDIYKQSRYTILLTVQSTTTNQH